MCGMARVGFEPTNPKERFYRPLRLTRLRYRAKNVFFGATLLLID